jgi:hypothetical protein
MHLSVFLRLLVSLFLSAQQAAVQQPEVDDGEWHKVTDLESGKALILSVILHLALAYKA